MCSACSHSLAESAWLSGAKNSLFLLHILSYVLLCALPAEHDQAYDLQYICPLAVTVRQKPDLMHSGRSQVKCSLLVCSSNPSDWSAPKDSSETPKSLLVTLSSDTLRCRWLNPNKSLWLAEPKHVITAQLEVFTRSVMTDTFTCYTKYTSNPRY